MFNLILDILQIDYLPYFLLCFFMIMYSILLVIDIIFLVFICFYCI